MNAVYETHSSGLRLGLYSAPALRVWPDRDKKLGIASSGMKKNDSIFLCSIQDPQIILINSSAQGYFPKKLQNHRELL